MSTHQHAPGIWCDECPDALTKRLEVLLHEHEATRGSHGCRCGWTNPLDGTPHAHVAHVAAAVRDLLASAVETTRDRLWQVVEDHLCDCGNFDGHPGDCACVPLMLPFERAARLTPTGREETT